MARSPAFLLVVLLIASACGKTETTSPSPDAGGPAQGAQIASCDRVPSMSVCSEHDAAALREGTRVLDAQCTKLRGTFTLAACPNTALVGSCRIATGELRRFYASGGAPFDAARARAECDAYHGRFDTGP